MLDITDKPRRLHDRLTLPSGNVVDLLDLDTSLCVDDLDCDQLTLVIKEKIIDLEFQVECVNADHHPDGERFSKERPLDRMWLAKLKKALAWSKLQLADVSMRKQQLSREKKAARNVSIERLFVDTAKVVLPADTFSQILSMSVKLAGGEDA